MSAPLGPYGNVFTPPPPIDTSPPSGPSGFVLEDEGAGTELISLVRRSLHIWRLGLGEFWRTWLFLGIAAGVVLSFVGPLFSVWGTALFGSFSGFNFGTVADLTPALLFAVAVLVFATGAMASDLTPWVVTHGRARPLRTVALERAMQNWTGLLGGALATAGSLLPFLLLEVFLSAASYSNPLLAAVLWIFGALLAVLAIATVAFAVSASLVPVVLADQGGKLSQALRASRFLTTSGRLQLFVMDLVPTVVLLGLYALEVRTFATIYWAGSSVGLALATGLIGPWIAANHLSFYIAFPEEERRPFESQSP